VLGLLRHAARQLPLDREALQEQGRAALIIFGRLALLPLIVILRDPSAPRSIPLLLRLGRAMKQTSDSQDQA
jgi:hypothetical protein